MVSVPELSGFGSSENAFRKVPAMISPIPARPMVNPTHAVPIHTGLVWMKLDTSLSHPSMNSSASDRKVPTPLHSAVRPA